MENTRTDYADMGKILRGPSTSFLGDKKDRLSGTISQNHFGPILDHIWFILTIFDLFRLVLGRAGPPGQPPDSQGVFPTNGRILFLEMWFMCFLDKVSFWGRIFHQSPFFSSTPIQSTSFSFPIHSTSNPLHLQYKEFNRSSIPKSEYKLNTDNTDNRDNNWYSIYIYIIYDI